MYNLFVFFSLLAASNLLIALVPSPNFRQAFRTSRGIHSPSKEVTLNVVRSVLLANIVLSAVFNQH